MNILSMLSFMNFILLMIGTFYGLEYIHKSKLALPFSLLFFSLSIWCFGSTFFYIAPDTERVLFWYRFCSIGWIMYPAFALHSFSILTDTEHSTPKKKCVPLLYLLPAILFFTNLLPNLPLHSLQFLQSTVGLGWTFRLSLCDLWYWCYTVYIFLYLILGLYIVYRWGRLSTCFSVKKRALLIILANSFVMSIGMTTDIILPLFTSFSPPIANIVLIVILIELIYAVQQHQLFQTVSHVTAESILNAIRDPVIVFDSNYKIVIINSATTSLLGYQLKDIQNMELFTLIENHKYNEDNVRNLFRNKFIKNQEINLITADSRIVHMIYSASIAENRHGEFLGYIISFKDITERKIIENELKASNRRYRILLQELFKAANYDVLTGLPNRRVFYLKTDHLRQRYQGVDQDFALIYLDLNGFKQVNDTYGHDIGDNVLVLASHELNSCLDRKEQLFRIGGDEFAMLLRPPISRERLDHKISKIKKQFESRMLLGEILLEISISAGYALYSESSCHIDTLVRNADFAMYQDKVHMKIDKDFEF